MLCFQIMSVKYCRKYLLTRFKYNIFRSGTNSFDMQLAKINLILSVHQETIILKYTSVLPVVRSFLGGRLNAEKGAFTYDVRCFWIFLTYLPTLIRYFTK